MSTLFHRATAFPTSSLHFNEILKEVNYNTSTSMLPTYEQLALPIRA